MREIDLSKVYALREARIRFWLFSKWLSGQVPDTKISGAPIVEAGVVMLSATFQAFVGDVFVEVSEKLFGRNLSGKELKRYRKTWDRWGNPNVDNITRLFRRLGVDDVFDVMAKNQPSEPQFSVDTFKKSADELNEIRNRIAHGQDLKLNGEDFHLSLSVLNRWARDIEEGSKRLRFSAVHQSGLGK